MQHESAKQDMERRLLLIERALLSLAIERQRAGKNLPEALDKLAYELAARGMKA
jgi:Flp pilus assembly protein TadB